MPNLAATLAAARDDVSQWLPAIQPPHPEYAALMGALAALQGAEAKGGWPALRAAGAHARRFASQRRRAAQAARGIRRSGRGFGRTATGTTSRSYRPCASSRNTTACPRPDGSTRRRVAALNVPLATRIRQVALNLERWRWLPDDLGARHFRVNIPYFHLEAYEQGKRRPRHPRRRRQAGQRDADLQRAHDARRDEPVLEHPAEDRHRRDDAGRVGRPRLSRSAEHRGGARLRRAGRRRRPVHARLGRRRTRSKGCDSVSAPGRATRWGS